MYGAIESATDEVQTTSRRSRALLAVVAAAAALAGAAAAVTVLGLRASSAELVQEDGEPTSEPTLSLCSVHNCSAPGACLLVERDDDTGVPYAFTCEVNPAYFTDASVCARDDGVWCDTPSPTQGPGQNDDGRPVDAVDGQKEEAVQLCQPWHDDQPWHVLNERDCNRLCRQLGLIGDDVPECERSWGPCDGSELKTFPECQVEFPTSAPHEHKQCVCGPEDGERTVACNLKPSAGRVPPLQCERMNITSEESCIDHQMKNDVYCTLGGRPTECIIKYQNIGGTMTCSTKWRRSFSVVCGDACAWTEDAFWGSDAGARLGPGLAAIIYAIFFF